MHVRGLGIVRIGEEGIGAGHTVSRLWMYLTWAEMASWISSGRALLPATPGPDTRDILWGLIWLKGETGYCGCAMKQSEMLCHPLFGDPGACCSRSSNWSCGPIIAVVSLVQTPLLWQGLKPLNCWPNHGTISFLSSPFQIPQIYK